MKNSVKMRYSYVRFLRIKKALLNVENVYCFCSIISKLNFLPPFKKW